MAYYDRLVRDPEAALDEIAARRNVSRDELLARLSAVREAAESGHHLTLGQAQSFFDDNRPPPPEVVAHVDGCAFCQAMLDGLHPRHLEQVGARLRKDIDAHLHASSPFDATQAMAVAPPAAGWIGWSRSAVLQQATGAALGFVLAIAVVAKPVAAYFSESRELVQLKAENDQLRDSISRDASLADLRMSAAMPEQSALLASNTFAQVNCELRDPGSDRGGVCVLPPSVKLTPGDKLVILNVTREAGSDVPELHVPADAPDSPPAADAPRN